eukprot:TRINITY_DN5486_c0_g1_i1.p1 TRINITY_DN5486_c0_g1~~TRINITY_DN5486_c0_g1_i1.p1  ORF type:complete len:514 (+),score=116.48 TRINITY_DN5486_c0_g1_i1:110-1651(+)
MGCGASKDQGAAGASDEKYKPTEKQPKGAASKENNGAAATSTRPRAGDPSEAGPSPIASPGGVLGGQAPHKVTVVHAQHRLECKFGDTELEHRQQLWSIIRGQTVIQRGAPEGFDERCSATIRTDFGGDINLILDPAEANKVRAHTARELERAKGRKKGQQEDDGFDARELLVSRAAAARRLLGLRIQTLRGHPKQVQVAQISPNDWLLVTSGSSLIGAETAARCSDIRTCLQVGTLDGKRKDVHDPIAGAAFTTDGQQLATVHRTDQLLLWDMNTFRVKRLVVMEREDAEVRLGGVATSPDMKLIGCASEFFNESEDALGGVPIYDFNGNLLHCFGHKTGVGAVAFSPDSCKVVSGSTDGELHVWEARTGEVIRSFVGHTHPIRAVAFSPDGATIYALDDKHLTAWNGETAEPRWTRPIGGTGPITDKSPSDLSPSVTSGVPARLRFTTVCLAASGIGFLGMTDRLVTVFDAQTGEEVDTVTTKAPVTAMSAGCRACALGDVWGNLYLVHIM